MAWLAALCLCTAHAQAPRAADPDAALAKDRQTVERIEKSLETGRVQADDLAEMRRDLLELQQRAGALAAEQAPLLQSAQARLAELGAPPATGDAPDVAEQRRDLEKNVSQLDARLKLARLLALTSEQLANKAGALARERFAEDLLRPTDPLLGARFRGSLEAASAADSLRLQRATRDLRSAAKATDAATWLAAAALVGLAMGLRWWSARLLERSLAERAPPTRLRRSLLVLGSSLLALLVPGLAAFVLALILGEESSEVVGQLLTNSIGMACFCGFLAGLGRALLAAKRPSWRLPRLSDRVALRLRYMPAVLAVVLFAGWFLQRLTELAQLSLTTLVTLKAIVALALALVVTRLLARSKKSPRERAGWPAWMLLASWLAQALLVVATVAIFSGYVALGSFLVGQLVWTLILCCAGYTLWTFIDDVTLAWASQASDPAAQQDSAGSAMALRRGQMAVLVSGLLRVGLVLLLFVLMLAPFGEGPSALLGRGLRLREGVEIGQLQLRPAAIAQAIVVAVGVFMLARLFQRWTAERLLPTTTLDVGMRSSIVTLVGFLGGVLAVALGLSAMGLALTQVAWIASALTVGIGFGMQAIVSNFVSGLILLAERPVKVGDWVALSGLEGDIRRMNVRTTEIQMADRSTVIVPNSEFITKVVRNVTHDSQAQGLVQIKLPMPLDTDTERVRSTLLQAFREHGEILQDPAPNVLLDGIEGDKLVFNATGFVASPRRVAATRSELLFKVMPQLRGGGRSGSAEEAAAGG